MKPRGVKLNKTERISNSKTNYKLLDKLFQVIQTMRNDKVVKLEPGDTGTFVFEVNDDI